MNLRSLWPLCVGSLVISGCSALVIRGAPSSDAAVDAPEPVDDGPALVFDDGPALVFDDGPTVLADDGPPLIFDGPPTVFDDGPPTVFDDGPPVIFDDGPPVIFDDGPPVIFDDGPDAPPDIPGPVCPAPGVMCGAECVSTATDMRHCGGCGQSCTLPHASARCGAGVCAVTACDPGFGDCDRDPRDGCEADLTARDHCGGCAVACAAGQICAGAVCRTPTCPMGMALIPEQTFMMGEIGVAEPVHPVHLSAYCLDATEVPMSAYRTCTAPGCTRLATGAYCNEGVAGRGDHPTNCATWGQADAYCRAAGKRLPTEAEWEHAARGTDDRRYPWGGDEPSMQLCWQGLMNRMSTCAVRSFPTGDSPFGLSDMAGNVWEWTSDWYADYPAASMTPVTNPTGPMTGARRVMRGGTWAFTTSASLHAATRGSNEPGYREFGVVGFRCASDGM